jgi:hypothetical protein
MTDNLKHVRLKRVARAVRTWVAELASSRGVKYSRARTSAPRPTPRSPTARMPAALRAPPVQILVAGSHRALRIAQSARWTRAYAGVDADGEPHAHVDAALLPFLDVAVVATRDPPLASLAVAREHMSLESRHMCSKRLRYEGGWRLVRRPTLVVRPGPPGEMADAQTPPPEIIGLYITAECDDRLARVFAGAEAAQAGMRRYLNSVQFNRRVAVDRYREEQGQGPGRGHWGLGSIQMDGIFRFRHVRGFGYYWRDRAAERDRAFLESQARLYCGMSLLESQHAPVMAAHRRAIAAGVPQFEGVFPGLGVRMCAASSVGASAGYACDSHNDSSVPGLTESIFWTAPEGAAASLLPPGEEWTFANAEAGLLFDLRHAAERGGCCLYIPGSVMHNSMPTRCRGHTVHRGMGFVLVNKSPVLGPASRSWFTENPDALVVRPSSIS